MKLNNVIMFQPLSSFIKIKFNAFKDNQNIWN